MVWFFIFFFPLKLSSKEIQTALQKQKEVGNCDRDAIIENGVLRQHCNRE
jgi:hypothetical protein